MNIDDFRMLIKTRGDELWREMPWRDDTRAYYVLVSELMLQQTQVSRVVPKFIAFIGRFPDENSLARASLVDVLKVWQGLGYNRRAKYLHEAAKKIVHEFGGDFPQAEIDILSLPGVGKNTAGAIRAYVFNQPSIFVETNIRTVYIHHFFTGHSDITDKQITEKLEVTIDRNNPRRFYQALMDYGSSLKASGVKNNARSKHYKKQSPLRGSLREMRGEILRRLTRGDTNWRETIEYDARFEEALRGLEKDRLVTRVKSDWHLTKH